MIARSASNPAPGRCETARSRRPRASVPTAAPIRFVDLLHVGDLVIANDAATLPASLFGEHIPRAVSQLKCASPGEIHWPARAYVSCIAVVFGGGDFRLRTEDRPLPPEMKARDGLTLGPLRAYCRSYSGASAPGAAHA